MQFIAFYYHLLLFTTFITIIYGEKVSEAQANLAYDAIQAKYGSSVDITLVNGGQPLYYFLISVE